jgi:putative hydrolase of the HAD superfamily
MSHPEIQSTSETTRLVSFDLWLTLIRNKGRAFKNHRNALMRDLFAPGMSNDEFDRVARQADKDGDELAETRGTDVLFADRVELISRALGVEALGADELDLLYDAQTAQLEHYPPELIEPRTADLLASLAERYELAVVSNTGFIHGSEMRNVLAHLGIGDLFSYKIFSNEVGYAKPDSRIYKALTDASGVAPGEIVHIGDNIRADVQGATDAGMRTVHINESMPIALAIEGLINE